MLIGLGEPLPNMTRKMLTPREAQLTRRKVGTEESLTLLLLRRPPRVGVVAVVVGSDVLVVVVAITHLHILLRADGECRLMRVSSLQCSTPCFRSRCGVHATD